MPKIEWLSEKVAAERVGLKPRTLRIYAKSGKMQVNYTVRPSGRGYQYEQKSLEQFQLENSTITKN